MPFKIEVARSAAAELKGLRPFDRKRLLDEMEKHLTHEPTVITRNRKCLGPLPAGFEHIPPIWELRAGEYRVFYDVDAQAEKVFVRAVRRKEPHQTTEDIVT